MTTDITSWGDKSQYVSEPVEEGVRVHLLWMTPDPLGAIAAMCGIYEGKVFRSLLDVTDEDRRNYWAQVQKTHLRAPLEAVKLHFLIEGVDRSFTHQLVRQRTAVYAQESLRFAVKEDLTNEALMPPSIAALEEEASDRQVWVGAMAEAQRRYEWLVNHGVPAEDARSVLPHAVTTRIHYVTDLRGLTDHAGNRLCTQAQFIWRLVFLKIMEAIKAAPFSACKWRQWEYEPFCNTHECGATDDVRCGRATCPHCAGIVADDEAGVWQFNLIADSMLFRPVCYELNRCPFQASFDRPCTIRDRVEAFAKEGVPSSEWSEGIGKPNFHSSGVETINPAEWMLNPDAAR